MSISGFLLRIIINAIIALAIAFKLPGMTIDTLGGALLGVSVLGVANAAIRPLLLSALQADFFALAILTLLINIFASFLVVKILPGFEISNFLSLSFLISFLFLTLCSVTLTKFIKDR